MRLSTPLGQVLRTTPQHLACLEGMGLHTVEDLVLYLPRAHEDLSAMHVLRTAPFDQKGSFRGIVDHLRRVRTKSGKVLVTADFTDTEGEAAEVIWFNQPHVLRMLKSGQEIVLTGKLTLNGKRLQLQSPKFEQAERGTLLHAGRLVPIYPEHELINTVWLREKMVLVQEAISELPETLPAAVVMEELLPSRSEAIHTLHFPESGEALQRARERMAFQEMYALQREALERKQEWQGEHQERLRVPMDVELIRAFFQSLNFTPTNSQKIAIYEILRDMEKDQPMSRLLEGDVGSGKTLVATAVIANVLRNKGQCALMVPTEVLARQHTISIGKTLIAFHTYLEAARARGEQLPIMPHPTVQMLTGSVQSADAKAIRHGLTTGAVDLVIGTHALIQDSVTFRNLQLVVVDEQHRFGVVQRAKLKEKGSPHFLSMTATPIPRTLALTAHGHHDLSVLTEKPGNRKRIHTKVVSPSDRTTVERFIDQQIGEGRQAFVICPLINESENEEMNDVKNVTQEVARLKEGFPHRRIIALHGRMSAQEKESTMHAFKNREYDILVSTSVIEVGIDIPNSTIIVIEGAERFGLSQLHQFRGRVGRSDHQSHCFLFTTTPQQAYSERLKAMEQHDSGFLLAEIDLQIRGPGELFGLRQSGLPEYQAIGLLNPELVVRARRAAERALGMRESTVV
jgi:ATP-dependent DNA helicase RecG